MVKVIDIETKDVIKEFPPEKILDMVAKMWEVAGIMVDERR
jgi:flagellar protein FlaG